MPNISGSYGRLAGWQAGRLADEIRLDFETFKILYKLNYLDFYFVDISVMLLIVLEVHFSLFFSNKMYFRMCLVVYKILSPFYSCQSLLLGTSVPNDMKVNKKHTLELFMLRLYVWCICKVLSSIVF